MIAVWNTLQPFVLLLSVFAFLSLGARQFGQGLSRFNLPLISGYLIAGILVGPFVLDLIQAEAIADLAFVDDVALAFIAFSAGNELYIKEIRPRLRGISLITLGIAIVGGAIIFTGFLWLAPQVAFMRELDTTSRVAIVSASLAVIVSLSPAATIAVISELRARGPLTKTAVGVSVVADVVVIVGFAIALSLSETLLSGVEFNVIALLVLGLELLTSLVTGYLLGGVLKRVLQLRLHDWGKTFLILLTGYAVFEFSRVGGEWIHDSLHIEFHLESLLVCLVAAMYVTNYTGHRNEFTHLLEEAGPLVYLAFFTLTGIALELDVLFDVWLIALALVLLRAVGVIAGAFVGGLLAREPLQRNLVGWMPYITQAGVGLGLAKGLTVLSADWGLDLASLLIGVIVINQLVGPPLFRFALTRLGETHTRAEPAAFDGAQDVVILGIEDQSLALAQELLRFDWQVKLIDVLESARTGAAQQLAANVHILNELTPQTLADIDFRRTDVLLAMSNDDDLNYRACEIAFENFGTPRLIVRVADPSATNIDRFRELGVRIINPHTAMLSLLNQFVRSPGATTLLLGMDDQQRVEEVTLSNTDLHGRLLRDLRLPTDVLILSIRRGGQLLVTHGYTHLELNDHVSVIGSPVSIEAVRRLFE